MAEWIKFDTIPDIDEDTHRHLTAAFWSIMMILFGYLVISMDTRNNERNTDGWTIRDRILGIEQRYFVIFFNGLLLYGSLVHLLKTPADV